MEQNLSERERKQRLFIGALSGAAALYFLFLTDSRIYAAILGIASIGFIANYFTCFCGTKRALNKIKNRF